MFSLRIRHIIVMIYLYFLWLCSTPKISEMQNKTIIIIIILKSLLSLFFFTMQLYRTLYISTVCIEHCSATLLWHQCKTKWNWGRLPHWLGYICFDYRFNASKGVDSWFNLVTIKILNVSVNTLLNRDDGKMEVDWPRSWQWGCIKRRLCDSCVFQLPIGCISSSSVLKLLSDCPAKFNWDWKFAF